VFAVVIAVFPVVIAALLAVFLLLLQISILSCSCVAHTHTYIAQVRDIYSPFESVLLLVVAAVSLLAVLLSSCCCKVLILIPPRPRRSATSTRPSRACCCLLLLLFLYLLSCCLLAAARFLSLFLHVLAGPRHLLALRERHEERHGPRVRAPDSGRAVQQSAGAVPVHGTVLRRTVGPRAVRLQRRQRAVR
jgi:hypothetical protein